MTTIEHHHRSPFRNIAAAHHDSSTAALLPIMSAVFVAFLVIGIAIPVLPLHVHQGLGLGTFIVGLDATKAMSPREDVRIYKS
jgi:hypothetical protein